MRYKLVLPTATKTEEEEQMKSKKLSFFFFFFAKADNSTFHVLDRVKKNTCLVFVISSDDNEDAWQTLL